MAEIIFSSSYDEKYPPENILDNQKNKYFISTGMYPQEICLQFNENRSINSINLNAFGIKKLCILTCESDSAVNFQKQAEQSKILNSNKLQNIKLDLADKPSVKVLKIVILEGYDDFFSINNISCL